MKLRHVLLMLGCVEVYALLRHHYSLAVACGLVLALVLKYFLCAWAVPILAAHWFLLQYATLAIGINLLRACLRLWRGSATSAAYTGHSPLWRLGMSTRTMMYIVEPLLAACVAGVIIFNGPAVFGLVSPQWPYTPLQPLRAALTLPQGYYAFLHARGAIIALGVAVLLPLTLRAFNNAEFSAYQGPPKPRQPVVAASTPVLTFEEVQAAPGSRGDPSAARLAAAGRAHRKASTS
jgi:hypothetical protein